MSEANGGAQGQREEPRWEDRREIRTSAPPDRAWQAWADPDRIQGWFADEAEGSATPGSSLVHRFPAMGMEMRYEVLEAEPGRRLLLRMAFPGRPPVTQEIVVRTEAGQTVIELVNAGFGAEDWDGQFEGIDSGWKLALAQLRYYLEHQWGKRRHVWLAFRPARLDWSRLESLFRQPEGLSRWLTTHGASGSGIPGNEGEPVSLELRDFTPLNGDLLADSGKEVLLSWSELEAALELKAFAAGPETGMVGLRLSSWAADPPDRTEVQAWMDTCAGRLASAIPE